MRPTVTSLDRQGAGPLAAATLNRRPPHPRNLSKRRAETGCRAVLSAWQQPTSALGRLHPKPTLIPPHITPCPNPALLALPSNTEGCASSQCVKVPAVYDASITSSTLPDSMASVGAGATGKAV